METPTGNPQTLVKRLAFGLVLLQLLALVAFVALRGGRDDDDASSRIFQRRRLPVYTNDGMWAQHPCTAGSTQYCWYWQPHDNSNGFRQEEAFWGATPGVEPWKGGYGDDAWSSNDDGGWTHYDDFYHADGASDEATVHDDHTDDHASTDDYHYDDQYWHDDYYHTDDDKYWSAPHNDDDYVYKYESVPEAYIINTPNGGYGGRRGRSLEQVRFNKCPPVIDGYDKTAWRYQPSKYDIFSRNCH